MNLDLSVAPPMRLSVCAPACMYHCTEGALYPTRTCADGHPWNIEDRARYLECVGSTATTFCITRISFSESVKDYSYSVYSPWVFGLIYANSLILRFRVSVMCHEAKLGKKQY